MAREPHKGTPDYSSLRGEHEQSDAVGPPQGMQPNYASLREAHEQSPDEAKPFRPEGHPGREKTNPDMQPQNFTAKGYALQQEMKCRDEASKAGEASHDHSEADQENELDNDENDMEM